MAPANTRKRKSDQMDTTPQAVTRTGSPASKKVRITQSQKQALIDNLQLEVTERARHLRAHYALQCADLRSRIERRINRIPMGMRNMTMGELAMNQEAPVKQKPLPPIKPTKSAVTKTASPGRPLPSIPQDQVCNVVSPPRQIPQPQPLRNKKRKSSEIDIVSDKENESITKSSTVLEPLPVQKNAKRSKTTATTGVPRAASRTGKNPQNVGVLSPRSHNSRTLPRSPIKDFTNIHNSPSKPSYIARPVSPLKPASPFKSAASAATSAISAAAHGLAKRGVAAGAKLTRTASREKPDLQLQLQQNISTKMLPPPPRNAALTGNPLSSPMRMRTASQQSNLSATSDVSITSTSTTVVTKPKRAGTTTKAATKKASTAKSTASKATAAMKRTLSKKENVTTSTASEPTTGRRILRKRN